MSRIETVQNVINLAQDNPSELITALLATMVIVGAFFNAVSPYFTAGVNGSAVTYAGCGSIGCGFQPLSIFNNSPFAFLINGDFVGFLSSFFTLPQSAISLISIIASALMIVLSTGIGFSGQVIASGLGITINEQGTRMAQSLGITLLIFSWVNLTFGAWFFAIGFGLGLILQILFIIGITWGAYESARKIA